MADEFDYASIIADPNLVDPEYDISRIKTTTPTSERLLAAVPEYSGLRFDPTKQSVYSDLYSLYSGGLDSYLANVDPSTGTVDTSVGTGGGGGGITTTPAAQNMGGAGGAQNPLTQMITTPTGDMTVKQAMTQDAAYSLPGESDPFLALGAAGGARPPATQATTTLPSGDVFATDDPMLQEKMDYTQQQDPNFLEKARDNFIATGQDIGNTFKDLVGQGIDISKMAGTTIANLIGKAATGIPLLGTAVGMLPGDTSEDTFNRQFAIDGQGFQDITTSDPDLGARLQGYSSDLNQGQNIPGKDPFGRNTVSAFGDYEKALAEDLQYRGDNQFNKDKQAYAQAYFDKKGIGLNPNEAKAFEEEYGISPTGAPVTRDRLIDEGIAAADQEDDMFEPTPTGVNPFADMDTGFGEFGETPTGITRPGTVLGKPGIEKFDDAEADMSNTATAIDAFNAANRQKHFDNTQKLKDAVAEGKITPETYNKLSAFDATKTMGLDPITGTLSSIGYQGVQTLAGDQGISDFLGDTGRNIQGVSGNLTPEEQVQYQEIISGEDIYRDSILDMVDEPEVGTLAGDYGDAFEDYDIDTTPTVTTPTFTPRGGGADRDPAPTPTPKGPSGPPSVISRPAPTFTPRGGGADRDPAPAPKDKAPSGPPSSWSPAPARPSKPVGRQDREGGNGGNNSCFLKGTQVTMADGSTKAVEQVDLGDEVAVGGKVFAVGRFLNNELHDYKGIKVSGSHMVNEDGNWTRVEDSKHGKPLGDDEHTVYVFGAENRRILINNILFTDYFEVNEQEKLSDGDKFFDNWKLHAKVDSDNNVNVLNAN